MDNRSAPGTIGPDENPLAWLKMECQRLTNGCLALDALAESAAGSEADFTSAAHFLRVDIQLIFQDETHDLLPAVLKCMQKGDDLAGPVSALRADRATVAPMIRTLLPILDNARRERAATLSDPAAAAAVTRLAGILRHHLAILNAVVLPIARLRLDADDLAILRESLNERRRTRPG